MKYITTLLLSLISLASLSQDSWVNVEFQPDQYPGETSWEIYQDSVLVATSPPYNTLAYTEVMVYLPIGEYSFVMYDSFGDGICCAFGEGFLGLTNYCGLDTFIYDFGSPTSTVYFDLLACPPPIFGCIDDVACNYDSTATDGDGSCDYSCLIFGCMNPEALNFNPWATNGTQCTFPPSPCDIGETGIVILTTPDSYPGETSWELIINGDTVATSNGFTTPAISQPAYFCVAEGDTIETIIYDTFGDGLCGSCWGGIDGSFNVSTACGDSIFTIGGDQQFDVASSGPYIVPQCISYQTQGCTTLGYVEYDPIAIVDDGSCNTPVELGCIDITMFNYDVLANTMDVHPSCQYTLTTTDGGADGWFGSWLGLTQGEQIYGPYEMGPEDGYEASFELDLNSNEEVNVYFFTSGNSATTAAQCGFRLEGPNGIVLQSGTNPWTDPLKKFPFVYEGTPTCLNYCEPYVEGCMDILGVNYSDIVNTDDGSCFYDPGCMNVGYLEYYTQGYVADFDDGSCNELAVFGCIESEAFNYNPSANVGTECTPIIIGCMNILAFNYDINANTAGECIPIMYGCNNASAINYDEEVNTDDGSCILPVYGCTYPAMFNFDPLANVDNNSCIPFIYGCMDIMAFNYDPEANTDNNSCTPILFGCTDEVAFNYDPEANADNNSCVPIVLGCTNPIAINYDLNANTNDLSCILPIYGCTDSNAFNYNELANVDNETCIEIVEGCTDPSAFNYNPEANTEDFSCIDTIYGCTDSLAFNYSPEANTDNGSCIDTVVGCTDQNAFNYNEFVNTDDGSCLYDAGCIGEPGNPYWLNDGCYAWVIDVSPNCCNTEWNGGCQDLYNYCELNDETVGLTEYGNTQIKVFPNPTTGFINIATSLQVDISLYNVLGQLVLQENNAKQIDINNLNDGMYQMVLTYEGNKFIKKIIKQ